MGMGKGIDQPKPVVAGLDEIDVATNQTDVPPSYFAGARKLNVSWIMNPTITQIVTASQPGGKGK